VQVAEPDRSAPGCPWPVEKAVSAIWRWPCQPRPWEIVTVNTRQILDVKGKLVLNSVPINHRQRES